MFVSKMTQLPKFKQNKMGTYMYYMALTYGVVSWFAVCDCGIF